MYNRYNYHIWLNNIENFKKLINMGLEYVWQCATKPELRLSLLCIVSEMTYNVSVKPYYTILSLLCTKLYCLVTGDRNTRPGVELATS